jgi:hypothetical protein
MTARILAVHGIGQYESGAADGVAAQMSVRYSAALGQDVTAVYYAHLLRDAAQQTTPTDRLDPDEEAILRDWAIALGVPAEVSMGYPAAPVRLLADWIARRIARTDDDAVVRRIARLLTTFARDAAAYLTRPDRRDAVRRHLAAAIADHGCDVMIAHSLGSVVAYETLWSRPDLRVARLITAGSPLAMPGAVFDRLVPPPAPDARDGRGAKPPNVDRWINFADPADIVAIPRPLHRRFHGMHRDDDRASSIGALAVHGFTRYLQDPQLAAALA